jgi:hypothetical protein
MNVAGRTGVCVAVAYGAFVSRAPLSVLRRIAKKVSKNDQECVANQIRNALAEEGASRDEDKDGDQENSTNNCGNGLSVQKTLPYMQPAFEDFEARNLGLFGGREWAANVLCDAGIAEVI